MLENLAESGPTGEEPEQLGRSRLAEEPEQRLVLRGITYGSDLVLVVEGGVAIGLAFPGFIVALHAMRRNKERTFVAKTRKAFRRILEANEGSALRKAAEVYAAQNGITLDDVLDLLGEEFREIYNNKALFVPEQAPYK